jgi:hypothetical protein
MPVFVDETVVLFDTILASGGRRGLQIEVGAAVERVIAALGLRLDRAAPIVDARLPDGSRLHVIPPAAVDGPVGRHPAFHPGRARCGGVRVERCRRPRDDATIVVTRWVGWRNGMTADSPFG